MAGNRRITAQFCGGYILDDGTMVLDQDAHGAAAEITGGNEEEADLLPAADRGPNGRKEGTEE